MGKYAFLFSNRIFNRGFYYGGICPLEKGMVPLSDDNQHCFLLYFKLPPGLAGGWRRNYLLLCFRLEPPWGIEMMIDELGAMMLLLLTGSFLLIVVYSIKSIPKEIPRLCRDGIIHAAC